MSQGSQGQGSNLDIFSDVAAQASSRLEGRDPELLVRLQRLEHSSLGVAVYWHEATENPEGEWIMSSSQSTQNGELIGYVLPVGTKRKRVLAFFDNGDIYLLPKPKNDPAAAAQFEQVFRPGAPFIEVQSPSYSTALDSFLVNAPYEQSGRRYNRAQGEAREIIEAIKRAVQGARRTKAIRDLAGIVTSRTLMEEVDRIFED